jgi:two-component system, NtrC family, sensor histidine kinase HydH
MAFAPSSRYRVLAVVALSLATVAFHYGFILKPDHGDASFFHAIHGRLCYMPIILGAIWFGVRGGVGTALFITVLTLPYARAAANGAHAAHTGGAIGEYTEMIFYLAIGLTAGILIELQRRERRRGEALARELAREKHLSSLGQMAAGLAHEIKNPLGSIKGSAEILSDDFPEGSRKHEMMKVLLKETDRLNRVVEDFLNFARPRPIARTPTRIRTVVEGVVSQIELDAAANKIRLVRDFDETIPEASLDGEKLHQVFLNLALNAVSAMPDGGTLVFETRRRSIEGKPFIVVSVKDDGTGIDPDDIEGIFDPFFTRSEKGTGLGLSISHTIVRKHGGRIEVAPNHPKGTVFSVILPVTGE